MPAETTFETVRNHAQRTHHLNYTWSLESDYQFIVLVLGRRPVDTDRYVGILRCQRCDQTVLNVPA